MDRWRVLCNIYTLQMGDQLYCVRAVGASYGYVHRNMGASAGPAVLAYASAGEHVWEDLMGSALIHFFMVSLEGNLQSLSGSDLG